MTDSIDQNRAREIFIAACVLETQEQASFVRDACRENEILYKEVMSLLRFDAMTESGDGISDGPHIETENDKDVVPSTIGSYEIKSKIGQGGGGVVYRAYQRVPIERTVALKLIRPGMDSGSVLRRFEFERRALERMNHPNIARVLDSGIVDTAEFGSQRPFFVMELVEGVPITQYVKDQSLELRDRLELIIQVCAAVQHAHSKGIMHRDIKPSNILVTQVDDHPHCKVIDFGIAKALDESLMDSIQMTNIGAMVGTPRYMSPEQMSSEADIDTRTDVYSIGVVLYELLTGKSPYTSATDTHNISALLREIESTEPPRPSDQNDSNDDSGTSTAWKTRTQFPRDLDWITLRALEKEPSRRYQTVAGLADDLRRYLRNEPVEAGPPTVHYKLTKFFARNRASVLGASVALLALIIGTTVSIIFAMQANTALNLEKEQRKLAQRNEQRVRDINDFLLDDLFESVSVEDLGQDATLVELLDRAAPTIDERFANDVHMRARVHYLIGEMYGSVYVFDKSLHHLNETGKLLDQLDEWSLIDKSQLYRIRGRTYLDLGMLNNAKADFEKSYDYLQQLDVPPEDSLQVVRVALATIYGGEEDFDRAEPMLKDAIEYALAQDEIDYLWLSKVVTNRVAILGAQDRYEEVVNETEWMIDFFKDQDAHKMEYATLVARIHRSNSLGRIGRAEEASASVDDMLQETERIFGRRSPAYASMLQTGAVVAARIQQYERAVAFCEQAILIYNDLYGPHNYDSERFTNDLSMYYNQWGKLEEFRETRTQGLLLRIYVAGPGEDESLIGVTQEGIALLGSREAWETAVTNEFVKVPKGHNKRSRFLANAAIALGIHELNDQSNPQRLIRHEFQSWLEQAYQATEDAERPDEIIRILQGIMPSYFERMGNTDAAEEWRLKLEPEQE
jgi:serine/threonine protein kinase